MLSFIESLKQIVADVQATGGAVVERSGPSSDLLRRLKEYAIRRMGETNPRQWVMLEWFTEGFFDEYVRVGVVHRRKLTLEDEALHYRVLTKVIDQALSNRPLNWSDRHEGLEDQLAFSLSEIWGQMGDEQTLAYGFARDHWLINWDYQQSLWKATGLGQFFLELSPIQASTFLLSIDSLFSTGENDFRHISAEILTRLCHEPSAYDIHLRPLHRDMLARLGLLRTSEDEPPDLITLTPISRIVIARVLDQDSPLRDAAARLIETEELGGTYKDSRSELDELLSLIRQTELADDPNRQSVITSTQLYLARKYLDSLRVLYPSIEAIINSMIVKAGEQPEQFRGLVEKARWLEQRGHIPPDVSNAMEVFTGRDRVLHGNFSPPEDYVFPLCLLAFRYLRRLLTEYRPAVGATGSPA